MGPVLRIRDQATQPSYAHLRAHLQPPLLMGTIHGPGCPGWPVHARRGSAAPARSPLRGNGAQARTLGPWSSARQLAEGRGAAAAAREDRIRDSAAAAAAAAAGAAALAWSPRRDFRAGPAPARRVPSLVALCVDLVVQHLEDVDTLWGLADVIRARPAAAVSWLNFHNYLSL